VAPCLQFIGEILPDVLVCSALNTEAGKDWIGIYALSGLCEISQSHSSDPGVGDDSAGSDTNQARDKPGICRSEYDGHGSEVSILLISLYALPTGSI